MSERFVDLHLHTAASDGTQEIPDLVARAAACGFSTIAITDHGTISQELTERITLINRIEVITGVGLKLDFDGIRGELLGYFVDPSSPSLREIFTFMRRARKERMARMIERCRDHVGLDISTDEVSILAAGSIGRPYLAHLLVEKGFVPSMREAFNQVIRKSKPCYFPPAKPDFRKAVHAACAVGGLTSIPHPCLIEVGN